MGDVRTFEDLRIWQRARALNTKLYAVTNAGPFRRDFGLRDQVRRASISIMANIAEGFERATHGDRLRFLSFAKASAGEVRSHLYAAFDLGYLSQEMFLELKNECIAESRMIAANMDYLQKDAKQHAREPIFEYGNWELDETLSMSPLDLATFYLGPRIQSTAESI
jgi:four helix bundle protein